MLLALVLVALWAFATPAPDRVPERPAAADRPALAWAPPALNHPKTVVVDGGFLQLDPARDYVVRLPRHPIGPLDIEGGHDVVLLGGEIRIPDRPRRNAGLRIFNATGTVHVEGLAIEGSPIADADGIDIAAPRAVVQLENVRVTGLTGTADGEHADLIQTYGGVRELQVDRFTGTSAYQGFFLRSFQTPGAVVGRVTLRHVDLQSFTARRKDAGSNLLWWTTGCDAPAATLVDVYLGPSLPDGRSLGYSVFPQLDGSGGTRACRAVADARGTAVSWPQLPIDGVVHLGPPPGGEFVPEGAAGASYASPGYVRARGRPAGAARPTR